MLADGPGSGGDLKIRRLIQDLSPPIDVGGNSRVRYPNQIAIVFNRTKDSVG
jgi:hypothetical protein